MKAMELVVDTTTSITAITETDNSKDEEEEEEEDEHVPFLSSTSSSGYQHDLTDIDDGIEAVSQLQSLLRRLLPRTRSLIPAL